MDMSLNTSDLMRGREQYWVGVGFFSAISGYDLCKGYYLPCHNEFVLVIREGMSKVISGAFNLLECSLGKGVFIIYAHGKL